MCRQIKDVGGLYLLQNRISWRILWYIKSTDTYVRYPKEVSGIIKEVDIDYPIRSCRLGKYAERACVCVCMFA